MFDPNTEPSTTEASFEEMLENEELSLPDVDIDDLIEELNS